MIQFFKSSFRELKHVVWPTREETKNYFIIVVSILIVFWIYLFIANTIFSEFITGLRDFIK
jgi:preprotein translocase SecE subunit